MRFFFNQQVVHLSFTAGTYGKEYFTTVTTHRWITKPQVIGDDLAYNGGAVGQMFMAYYDVDWTTTIDEGDLLKDTQGRMYKVKQKSYHDEGVFPYFQIVLIREK